MVTAECHVPGVDIPHTAVFYNVALSMVLSYLCDHISRSTLSTEIAGMEQYFFADPALILALNSFPPSWPLDSVPYDPSDFPYHPC